VDRRCRRLGDELGVAELGEADRLADEVELVLAVVRGVGDDDSLRAPPSLGRHPVDDPAQEDRHQCLGAVGRAAEEQRRRVAQPALELAGRAVRLDQRPPLGRLADEHLAVGAQADDRRDLRSPFAEGHDVDALPRSHCGGGERRTEVDSEDVQPRSLRIRRGAGA
jgi:hypothetical protein